MNAQEQLDIIKRGTVEIIEEQQLKEKIENSIRTKTPLIVKAGFDPSAPDIHLGHTVLLRKLAHFQKLGHKVIFLIGDATALVGDPSGQSQMRKMLSWDEVESNAITYEKQVGKILNVEDRKVYERRHNSEWFSRHHYTRETSPFDFEKFVELAQRYTVARLLERDDFQKRLKENKPISFLELFYPLMQGYDSVMLKADVEIGGNDQKFNMLVGRDLQRAYNQPEQVVITMPLLEGTDGTQKMSKSFGNYIGITESAKEMFGKVMSVSDELMWKYYELLTDVSRADIKKMKEEARNGKLNPKDAKVKLAGEIVTTYHKKQDAEKVAEEFERVFKNKGLPEHIPVYETQELPQLLWALLTKSELAASASAARRLIQQGGVNIDGKKITDVNTKIMLKEGMIIKVGKRGFRKISISKKSPKNT